MKTFQHPLSSEEEARQIRLLREGTPGEAAAARELLIERNLRLVAHIVKRYQIPDAEQEDLISVGTIGLIKAINSFDAGKGRLATYACRCIDNEILMLLRSRKKMAREVSLFESIGQDKEGNEIRLMDVIEQEQGDILEKMEGGEDRKLLGRLLKQSLCSREREILILRYGLSGKKEMTQNEIGKFLGISRSYVSRIEKRALEKLRRGFSEYSMGK